MVLFQNKNQHSEQVFTSIGAVLESSFDSLMSLCRFLHMLGSLSLKSNMLARALTESSSEIPESWQTKVEWKSQYSVSQSNISHQFNVVWRVLLLLFYHRVVHTRKVRGVNLWQWGGPGLTDMKIGDDFIRLCSHLEYIHGHFGHWNVVSIFSRFNDSESCVKLYKSEWSTGALFGRDTLLWRDSLS